MHTAGIRMKKIGLLLLTGVLAVSLLGCFGKRYHVDYHGQEYAFTGAKKTYAAGQKVKLKFDLIATDTDYSFYVVGAEHTVQWEPKNGYVIRFTMPEHDVEVYYDSRNTMVNQEYDMEPGRRICLIQEEDRETPDGVVSMKATEFFADLLTVVIRNGTDADITFGEDYHLQLGTQPLDTGKPDAGMLYLDLEPLTEYVPEGRSYTLSPGEEQEMQYDLSIYGELSAGDYRLFNADGYSVLFSLDEAWTE